MDFQKTLISTIIKAWFKLNMPGMAVPTGISESQCASLPFSWAAGNQSQWPCRCNKVTSRSQSPIAMGSELPDVKNAEDDVLSLNFITTYSITYGLIIQEPEFYGDFGTFTWANEKEKITYNALKLVFKIGKGEHQIADNVDENVRGEMQIHGVSTQGKTGVVAVQFSTGRGNNEFITSLNPRKWNYNKSKTAKDGEDPKICLKGYNDPNPTKYNLAAFFKLGAVAGDRSFFKYSGSLTKPPCTEQVDWFVLKATAKISGYQLEYLKQYGLTLANIAPNNIRSTQPLNGRQYSFSVKAGCPELPPAKVEPPNLDYKYLSMSHTTTIPAMASESVDAIKETFDK